jgi:hypothetical protein
MHPPVIRHVDVQALSGILEDDANLRLARDLTIAPGDDPLASILDGSADLAIVDNTRPFEPGVRTVLNLYTAVVHLSFREDFDPAVALANGDRLKVELLPDSHAGRLITDLVRERSPPDWPPVELWDPQSGVGPDMQIYLGPINPRNLSWFRPGFRLAELNALDSAGAEFYIEGIRFLVPQFSRTRIPALTYTLPGNEAGIDALSVDMLLVSHRRVKPPLIYALTKTLVEQKARFAAVEPDLFRWLNSSFDVDGLAFPLHPGARMYMERDEPGFLERYAETLNFLVYLTALLVTGTVGFGRWRARRRKDRVDAFYQRVIELRREARRHAPEATLEALEAIESDAFTSLMNERLAANDSFRIFMDLAEGLRRELKEGAPRGGGGPESRVSADADEAG